MRIEQSILEHSAAGGYLFDFGKTAFSRLSLELEGNGGETVAVLVGENVRGGSVDLNPPGFLYRLETELTLQPGRGSYSLPIPPHHSPYEKSQALKVATPQETGGEIAPFRYVQILHYAGTAKLIRTEFFPDFDDAAAHFECDDRTLNRIWELCKYTVKATACFGLYVDGQRERLPYEADTYVNQLGHFCCDANYSIARRTIDFLLEHPNWPTEWRLLMPMIVRDYLLYSGDAESLRRWRPMLEKSLLLEYTEDNGLLKMDPAPGIRDIVDWPRCERGDYEFGAVNFVPNCFLKGALETMGKLYGDTAYLRKTEKVRRALRRLMLKHGSFVDHAQSEHTSFHTAMYALYFRIASGAEIPRLKKLIRSRGMACSVYGSQFLLDTCYGRDMADHAFRLLTGGGMRSWRHMLAKGATITMEAWDETLMPNLDWTHAWGGAPANIIPRRLCGLRPVSPGFRTFVLAPAPGPLRSFYLRQATPCGPLIVEYENGKTVFHAPPECRRRSRRTGLCHLNQQGEAE